MKKIFFATLLAVLIPVISAHAASASCTFDRDLDLGVNGEDVRCLQKYLNGAGFTIASDGVGSPGNETSLFRDLTKKAIVSWQKANGLPASGFFGPASRKKYKELSLRTSSTASGTTTAVSLNNQISSLVSQINIIKSATSSEEIRSVVANVSQSTASTNIIKAIKDISSAKDQIKDAKKHGNVSGAEIELNNSLTRFFDGVKLYFDAKYAESVKLIEDASDRAIDAYEDAGGKDLEDEADELIDDISQEIIDTKDDIDEAEDKGKNVDEAKKLIKKADALLKDAKAKFKSRGFAEAKELARDARDMEKEAADAINSGGKNIKSTASTALKEAKKAINNAQNEIDDAKDDGQSVTKANKYLNKAKDAFDEAQDNYDDENYDDAYDVAKEARGYANDAIDEL